VLHFSVPVDLTIDLFEAFFRSYIEDGSIEVGTKEPIEILIEFAEQMNEIADRRVELRPAIDYRSSLLACAHRAMDLLI
jgi:hypothetical protein